MREIKFRAWDSKRKLMYEQLPHNSSNKNRLIYIGDSDGETNVIKVHREVPFIIDWVSINDVVLMQYTGLKDKNGVETYEGDILSNAIGDLFTIYFDKGCFFIHPIWKESDEFDIALYFCKNIPSVIGNIYEDQDLIK